MALTVDAAVAKVVGRLRGKIAFAGMSVVADHSNTDIVPAIADACWYFEMTPSDYPNVSDSDLATLNDPKSFFDAATLEALYLIRGSSVFVDQTAGADSVRLSQAVSQIDAMILDLQGRVPKPNYPRASMGQMVTPLLPFGTIPYGANYPFPPADSEYPYGTGWPCQ